MTEELLFGQIISSCLVSERVVGIERSVDGQNKLKVARQFLRSLFCDLQQPLNNVVLLESLNFLLLV